MTYDAKVSSRQEASVDGMSGRHLSGYSNANVELIQIYGGTVFYAPKNVEKYFKNLKALIYQHCQLKEIRQHDLKVFPQLLDLFLDNNNIEVLEEGLFDFNLELVFINMLRNNIIQVHPSIFDKSFKVTHAYIGGNACINKSATTPSALKELIQEISSECQNPEFLELESKFNNLENSTNSLSSAVFSHQLENLRIEVKNSKFSNFSSFEDRLEVLKIVQSEKIQQESDAELTTTSSPCPSKCQSSADEIVQKIDEFKAVVEVIWASKDNCKVPQPDADSKFDDKIKVEDESFADIVEQLEDKLERILKTLILKVTNDV